MHVVYTHTHTHTYEIEMSSIIMKTNKTKESGALFILVSLDFAEEFDTVLHDQSWITVRVMDVSWHLVQLLRNLHRQRLSDHITAWFGFTKPGKSGRGCEAIAVSNSGSVERPIAISAVLSVCSSPSEASGQHQ